MSIFGSFFKDKTLEKFDTKIDDLLGTMPNNSSDSHIEDQSGQLIDNFLSNNNEEENELGKLLESMNIPKERALRYATYEELYRSVPIIKRILRVYKANILQKNPITGKCIVLRDADGKEKRNHEESKETETKAKDFCTSALRHFKLSNKLENRSIPMQLLLGDCFFEVVDILAEADKKIDTTETDFGAITESMESSLDRIFQISGTPAYALEAMIDAFAETMVIYDEKSDSGLEMSVLEELQVPEVNKDESVAKGKKR